MSRLVLSERQLNLRVGDAIAVTGELDAFNLFRLDVTGNNEIEFRSLNEAVATVNEYGVITAQGVGITRVIATNVRHNQSAVIEISVLSDYAIVSPRIATGANHSVALRLDGSIWTWGGNVHGQLGSGSNAGALLPTERNIQGVVDIATTTNHTLFLKEDGTVWAAGNNAHGQLGDGTNINRNTPVQVGATSGRPLENIVRIAAGANHSVAIDENGNVFAWGLNSNGQLGIGNVLAQSRPVQVLNNTRVAHISDIINVSAGTSHTLLLRADGTVWAMGRNNNGQLGVNSTVQHNVPMQVGNSAGTNYLTNIISVGAGDLVSAALSANGTVYVWGLGSQG